MQNRNFGLLVAGLLVGLLLLGCAPVSKEVKKEAMSVIVTTPMVEIDSKAKVILYGTGFAPKQEMYFIFTDKQGVLTIINNALKPAPIPNAEGAWVTSWTLGRYTRVLKPSTKMITIADENYKTLAQAPVTFLAKPKPKKK